MEKEDELIEWDGHTLRVLETMGMAATCEDCFFFDKRCEANGVQCIASQREDGRTVIFQEVKS